MNRLGLAEAGYDEPARNVVAESAPLDSTEIQWRPLVDLILEGTSA